MSIFRHLLTFTIMLSVLLHAAVAMWLSGNSDSLPRPLAQKSGKWSIALQASAASKSSDVQVTPESTSQPVEPLTQSTLENASPVAVEIPQPQLNVEQSSSAPAEIKPTDSPSDVTVPVARMLSRQTSSDVPSIPVAESSAVCPAPRRTAQVEPTKNQVPHESTGSVGSLASEGSDVDVLPQAQYNPTPPYPFDALTAQWQGTVTLRLKVDARGAVASVHVQRSSGYRSLDDSASQTVRQWQFVPARRRGKNVPLVVDLPVRFVIRN